MALSAWKKKKSLLWSYQNEMYKASNGTCFILLLLCASFSGTYVIFLHHKITEHFTIWQLVQKHPPCLINVIQSLYLAMDDSQRETKRKSVASFEHSPWVTSKSLEIHSFRLMLIHISSIVNANEIVTLTEIKKPCCKYLMIVCFLFSIIIWLSVFLPCLCMLYLLGNSECQSFFRKNDKMTRF